ncbi:MAG: DUF86 domain-containing protein [Oscillospiraceae bacterium]|nr:DUF86 domain-containing protein [Oscillospiraceae bacterium]
MTTGDYERIRKILIYINEIEEDISEMALEDFLTDRKTKYAVSHIVAQIGELANKLSKEFRLKHNHISWSGVIGFRNMIVHHYGDISMMRFWGTLKNDIPQLKSQLELMIENNERTNQ